MATRISDLPKVRSEALRQSARNQPCSLRLSGCLPGEDTVVLAHIRTPGTGMGTKPCDTQAVYACHLCHDTIDGRRKSGNDPLTIAWAIIRGMGETHARMVEAGIITVKGDKG